MHTLTFSDRHIARAVFAESKVKYDLSKYTERHPFTFDIFFDDAHVNEDIYKEAVRPLLDTAMQGGQATCFAYGTPSPLSVAIFSVPCCWSCSRVLHRRLFSFFLSFFEAEPEEGWV